MRKIGAVTVLRGGEDWSRGRGRGLEGNKWRARGLEKGGH